MSSPETKDTQLQLDNLQAQVDELQKQLHIQREEQTTTSVLFSKSTGKVGRGWHWRLLPVSVLLGVMLMFGGSAGYLLRGALADGVPQSNPLAYAGYLEESGVALNGKRDVQVTLWTAATAGSKKCDQLIKQVEFTRGRFRIILPTTCTSAVHANSELWIQLGVRDTPGSQGKIQLLQRAKLGAVPYALQAQTAQTAKRATDHYTKTEMHTRFYTAIESNNRYYTKGDSDGRYYTKGAGDGKYAGKNGIAVHDSCKNQTPSTCYRNLHDIVLTGINCGFPYYLAGWFFTRCKTTRNENGVRMVSTCCKAKQQ